MVKRITAAKQLALLFSFNPMTSETKTSNSIYANRKTESLNARTNTLSLLVRPSYFFLFTLI